jgi:hypothetical protein
MPEASVVDFLTEPDGLFQFTISFPAPGDFPEIQGKEAMLFGYFFQVTDLRRTPDGQKTLLTIRKTKSRGASGSWDTLPQAGGQVLLPLGKPASSGGSGAVVIPAGGPFLIIGAVVAALAGLGLVYLIVDKVERIVESPAVSWVLVVFGVAVLVGLWASWEKGYLK